VGVSVEFKGADEMKSDMSLVVRSWYQLPIGKEVVVDARYYRPTSRSMIDDLKAMSRLDSSMI
jgi:hypothetical protein